MRRREMSAHKYHLVYSICIIRVVSFGLRCASRGEYDIGRTRAKGVNCSPIDVGRFAVLSHIYCWCVTYTPYVFCVVRASECHEGHLKSGYKFEYMRSDAVSSNSNVFVCFMMRNYAATTLILWREKTFRDGAPRWGTRMHANHVNESYRYIYYALISGVLSRTFFFYM